MTATSKAANGCASMAARYSARAFGLSFVGSTGFTIRLQACSQCVGIELYKYAAALAGAAGGSPQVTATPLAAVRGHLQFAGLPQQLSRRHI